MRYACYNFYCLLKKGELMRLTGELKKKVEQLQTKSEIKQAISDAGFELTEDELDNVTGGFDRLPTSTSYLCPNCGRRAQGQIESRDGAMCCKACGAKVNVTSGNGGFY